MTPFVGALNASDGMPKQRMCRKGVVQDNKFSKPSTDHVSVKNHARFLYTSTFTCSTWWLAGQMISLFKNIPSIFKKVYGIILYDICCVRSASRINLRFCIRQRTGNKNTPIQRNLRSFQNILTWGLEWPWELDEWRSIICFIYRIVFKCERLFTSQRRYAFRWRWEERKLGRFCDNVTPRIAVGRFGLTVTRTNRGKAANALLTVSFTEQGPARTWCLLKCPSYILAALSIFKN